MRILRLKNDHVINIEDWPSIPQDTNGNTLLEVSEDHPAGIGYKYNPTDKTFTWSQERDENDFGRVIKVSLDGTVLEQVPFAEIDTANT